MRAVLLSTAVLCAGCGSASQTTGPKLPLSAYLVQGHEETGMRTTGGATADRTPVQWTSGGVPDAAAENKRLDQEGFREVLSVPTGSTRGQSISWAMQLGSASAAAREQAAELQPFGSGPSTTRFTVTGVPGAKGWDQANTDANILFTEGRCLMLVGDEVSGGDQPPVIAAAHAIWARTHGKPDACAT
jgi:hypothetical protein